MTMPTHACPRCAHSSSEAAACPRGHGWLLDLSDQGDRAELSANAEMLRAPRAWVTEVRFWLAAEIAIGLVFCGIAVLQIDVEVVWAGLVSLSPGLLAAGAGLAGVQLWRRAGPRALRARRLHTLLSRTEPLVPQPEPEPEPEPVTITPPPLKTPLWIVGGER